MTTMNKHTRGSAGFSLTEMLVALLVLVLFGALAIAALNVATSVREESTFISDSDVLAGTINTALADCIHYKENTNGQVAVWLHGKKITSDLPATPLELKVDDNGHFVVSGVYNGNPVEERLLNDGAYSNLEISKTETHTTNFDGSIEYTIVKNQDKTDPNKHVTISYANLKSN